MKRNIFIICFLCLALLLSGCVSVENSDVGGGDKTGISSEGQEAESEEEGGVIQGSENNEKV